MRDEMPPLDARQYFSAVMHILGKPYLVKQYAVCERTVYKWGADPNHCEETKPNPLERLIRIQRCLCERGRDDVALSAATLVCKPLGYEPQKKGQYTPDKDNLLEEIIDDHPELVSFHRAMQDKEPIEMVERILMRLVQELEETAESYRQQMEPTGMEG